MNETPRQMSRLRKALLAILSMLAGGVLVTAAFKVQFLNWIVDVPGSFVSRMVAIDLHEGDGVFGFFFAIFLSWLWTSTAIWFVLLGLRRIGRRPRGA
jgi:hypothetical protein